MTKDEKVPEVQFLVAPVAALDGAGYLLDRDERRRAAGFTVERDARAYTAAHAAVRLLIGDRVGAAAADLRFGRRACAVCGGAHGKPYVKLNTRPVEFSLSHTRRYVAAAVSDVPIGIDIEETSRATTHGEAITSFLGPREGRGIGAVNVMQEWVDFEALAKATGIGLAMSRHSITFTEAGSATVELSAGAHSMQLLRLDCPKGLVGAIAADARTVSIVQRDMRELRPMIGQTAGSA